MYVKRDKKGEIIEARSHQENGCNEWLELNDKELKEFLAPKGV